MDLIRLSSSEAARECRRKKKEYIKCLEERVAGLENQNKALIEELRRLKELYCQREETSIKTTSNNNSKATGKATH
jgi:bZIP transcription factor